MPNRDEFPHVFEELKKILQSHAPPLVATTDTPDNYYLNTATYRTGKQPPSFFAAAVQLRKNYVSYHLMSVYMYPDLLDTISDRLKKRMQRKACFNFTTVDEVFIFVADVLPLILMSAGSSGAIEAARKALPTVQVLRKPFRLATLLAMLQELSTLGHVCYLPHYFRVDFHNDSVGFFLSHVLL